MFKGAFGHIRFEEKILLILLKIHNRIAATVGTNISPPTPRTSVTPTLTTTEVQIRSESEYRVFGTFGVSKYGCRLSATTSH